MHKSLSALAELHGTDKLQHGYCQFYEETLPKAPKKILEIGVKEGASIRMWKDWFPDTEIHGLDLFEEFPIPDIPGIVWHKGNQIDHLLLEQLRKEDFDIIIDDGSHLSRHQMMTFYGLFNGKHYYIEDLHCCQEEFYQDGLPNPLTARFVFDPYDGYYQTNYSPNSPIVLVKCENNAT
jgi:hypothetical protein